MPFIPRTFEQILEGMVSHVRANTIVSDFTVGSVARTILEAAALEDDEQYFQMVQLLDAFRVTTARGEDLDRRLADFGILRAAPTTATSRVRFFDKNLISDQVSQDEAAGSFSLTVFNASKFPSTGFPYTIRVGEGTTRVQDLSVTAKASSTFTVSTALANTMLVGDRVSLVTGASSHVINTGTSVQAPPTVSETPKIFLSQEPGFITAGNFFSSEVVVKASVPGTSGNVAASRITQFQGSPPFIGAGVINRVASSGGTNRETDAQFRQRALRQLQALSRGTPLAVRSAAIGVTDENTGQTTISANIIEDFAADEVIVYIDDGTGLSPDTVTLAGSSLNAATGIGVNSLPLVDTSNFPSSGKVLIEEDNSSNPAELVTYVSKDDTANTLTLSAATSTAHDISSTVLFVDEITQAAESGQRRFKLQNPPIVRGADRIFVNPGTGWIEQQPGTDYVLNRGTGEFQFTSLGGVATGTAIIAHYSYYINLIRTVQRVLEGDLENTAAFPGVKAAGIFLSVEAPTIKRITVVASISASIGFVEANLAPQVKSQIETYINSLKIGEEVVKSKMVDVAFNVRGLQDITVSLPTGNVTILENELPVPFAADGTSLVTIL